MATKTSKKAPVIEDDEELELETDELDEDEELDSAPAKKKKGGAAEEVAFGASDLAALLSEKTGKEIKTKDLRTLLRKMAREETPRISREVIPGNKARYSWAGPDDPEVKRIVKAVVGGELEAGKREALEKLKEKKAAQTAAKNKAEGKAPGKKAKAAAPVVEDDDEDFDLDDED